MTSLAKQKIFLLFGKYIDESGSTEPQFCGAFSLEKNATIEASKYPYGWSFEIEKTELKD